MSQSTARKERRETSRNGGPPKRTKPGSVSQRKLIDQLAQQVEAIDETISLIEIEMKKQGHEKKDPASHNGQAIMDVDGETQATYASWEARQNELKANLAASYPEVWPLVRKRVRRMRAEQDAQTD